MLPILLLLVLLSLFLLPLQQEKQRSTDASGISYAALNQSVKRLTASNKNLVTESARAALEIKKYTDILKVC
jgi:hypothetical protein